MASLDEITKISASISEHSKKLSTYLREHGKSFPSWSIDGPVKLDIPDEGEISDSYHCLLSNTKELHSLLLGPTGILMSMTSHVFPTFGLYVCLA
jgi:hypothetical protein